MSREALLDGELPGQEIDDPSIRVFRVRALCGAVASVCPAVDREPGPIEILLLRHPIGDRTKVPKVDPAPVFVDRRLPFPAVAGRAVDVRHHESDPTVDERRQMRQMRTECRTRLAL